MEQFITKKVEIPAMSSTVRVTEFQSRSAEAHAPLLDQNLKGPEVHNDMYPETPFPKQTGHKPVSQSIGSLNSTLVNLSPPDTDLTSHVLGISDAGHDETDVTADAQLTHQKPDAPESDASPRSIEGNEAPIGIDESEGHSPDGREQEKIESKQEQMTLACHDFIMEVREFEHKEEIIALQEQHENAIKELEERVKSLNSHNRVLRQRVKTEIETGNELEQTVRKLKIDLQNLDNELRQARLELVARDNTIMQLHGQIHGAAQQEVQLQAKLDAMQSDFNYTKFELGRLITEFNRVWEERESAKKAIDVQREHRAELELLAASRGQEIEDLQKEVTACRAEHAALQQEQEYFLEENEYLSKENERTDRAAARSTIKELEAQIEEKANELEAAVKDRDHYRGKSADLTKEVADARQEVLPVREELETVTYARDEMANKLKEKENSLESVTREKRELEERYNSLLKAQATGNTMNVTLWTKLISELEKSNNGCKRLISELVETKQNFEQSQRETQTARLRCKYLEQKLAVEVADRAKLTDANITLDCQNWELIMAKEGEENRSEDLLDRLTTAQAGLKKVQSLLAEKHREMIHVCLNRTYNGETLAKHYDQLVRNEKTAVDKAELMQQYVNLERVRYEKLEKEHCDNLRYSYTLERIDEDLRQRLATAEEGWNKFWELKRQLEKDSPMVAVREKSAAALQKSMRACARDEDERDHQLGLRAEQLAAEILAETNQEDDQEEDYVDDGEFAGDRRAIPEELGELHRRYRILFDQNGQYYRQTKDLADKLMEYKGQVQGLQEQVASLEAQLVSATEPELAESTQPVHAEVEAKLEGLTSQLETANRRVTELEGFVAGGIGAQAQAAFAQLEEENKALKQRLGQLPLFAGNEPRSPSTSSEETVKRGE